MKKVILILSLLGFFTLSYAKLIDEKTAKIVGLNFLKINSTKNVTALNLSYKIGSTAIDATSFAEATPFIYVFNTNANGFVIVSADDNVTPVLGYSDEAQLDANNIAPQTKKWLEGYKIQIRDVLVNGTVATDDIKSEWQNLLTTSIKNVALRGNSSVSPLVQTKWNQSPYYNALCPSNSVSGCVATAMTQIMKFWNYPANGSGFHSYNHSSYGTLSADFGSTTYQWASMPNSVNSSNNAVATLTYQVGVSVNMNYSPEVSGAYVITNSPTPQACSEYALKTYFGYKSTLHGIERANYSEAQWMSTIKGELDAGRPVLYAGFGSGGGHCFVADGYDNNSYIHFNWGWAGAYDGYFYINALNPSGTGTGGGSGGYNSGHQAVIGIEPNTNTGTGSQNISMKLYNYVSPTPSSVGYGQAFSVTTNIANYGTGAFAGDYCAAIFDNASNFIDFVQIKSSQSLAANSHYTSDLVFSNAGSFSYLPGTYKVGIYYKTAGGNWVLVANNGSYANFTTLIIVNNNNISLYSNMTVSPSTTLIQGQSASVNLNITNNGASTFFGQYTVALYNLDGTFAQNIGTKTESAGLQSGYVYLSPFLTFGSTVITVEPGTYLLATQHKANGGNWQLTGSDNYPNPIKVTVVAPGLQPDQYENNNTAATAYTLPVSFSGNNATKNTVGSNCHITSDVDYYKIVLPTGYKYVITPRIHDSYNSGNGNTYTLDGLFSYSTNGGSTWSDAYDDVMTGNITINNGGTVLFQVSPYFAGETGTYLLDMSIARSVVIGVKQHLNADNITVFPNPAKDFVMVDFENLNTTINKIELFNIEGQQVSVFNEFKNQSVLQISLQNLANGTYLLHVDTNDGLLIKKIIIEK